jgi:2',3'-cyclic-nucleotide 2'-phosphodiesterase (5'-nucleotidase family)
MHTSLTCRPSMDIQSTALRVIEAPAHGRLELHLLELRLLVLCLLVPSLLVFTLACSGQRSVPSVGAPEDRPETGQTRAAAHTVTIVGINDIYRIAGIAGDGSAGGGVGGLARVRTLRRELEKEAPDLLVLHAGDLLSPSLLSRRFFGAQMIDVLNLLDGDADDFDERLIVTFGNHEFDRGKLEHAEQLDLRIDESDFRWLGTNIAFSTTESGRPLIDGDNVLDSVIVDSGGVRVGIFGATIDSQGAAYIEGFGDPIETARRATADLRRRGAELVIGLTHLRESTDVALLEALGDEGPDLIIGGHEHDKLSRQVGDRWVLKADADARTATVVKVTLVGDEPPKVSFRWVNLEGDGFPEDPRVRERVKDWLGWFDEGFCTNLEPPERLGCVDLPLGRAGAELIAEELEIRRFETNFGNWVADQAVAAYAHRGAQIALINSGSLRLNQDLPAGASITRRQLEALLPFPAQLKLLRIPGRVLQLAIERAVQDWTGNGHWPQIAGFAFRHDPDSGTADRLTLLTPEGPRPIDADEELVLVISEFLADPNRGQDGYTMLAPRFIVDTGDTVDLKARIIEALATAGREGIAPEREGRICTVGYPGHDEPCLAVED